MPRPPAGPNPEDDLSDSESEDECAYDLPNLVVEEGKSVLADSLQMNKDDSRHTRLGGIICLILGSSMTILP